MSGQAARVLNLALAGFVLLWPFAWVLSPDALLRTHLLTEQFILLELTASLGLIALNSQWLRSLHLARIGYATLSLVLGLWLFFFFGRPDAVFMFPDTDVLVVAGLLLVLVIFGIAGYSGLPMTTLVVAFAILGYAAKYFPEPVTISTQPLDHYLVYIALGPDGLFGAALKIVASTVTIYLVFAAVFAVSGGAATVGRLASQLVGRGRGATVRACVIASGFFGMISGSAGSNVLTSGPFSIPAMRKADVSAETAAGIEATSSTCGQVMPPIMGMAAFLLADMSGLSYAEVALASLVPATMCYCLLLQQATRLGHKLDQHEDASFKAMPAPPEPGKLRNSDSLHLIPIAGLIGVLWQSESNVALAGIVATALSLLIGAVTKGPKAFALGFLETMTKTAITVASLVAVASAIGIILAVLNSTGLAVRAVILISEFGQHSLFMSLVLTAVACLVLGMGIPTAGVYIITGTLLAPGLINAGVPVVAAHLFVLYCGILSMITPPIAFAALVASGLAGANFARTSFRAMQFGWFLIVIPFVFVYAPGLVFVGDWLSVAISITSAVALLASTGSLLDFRVPIYLRSAALICGALALLGLALSQELEKLALPLALGSLIVSILVRRLVRDGISER